MNIYQYKRELYKEIYQYIQHLFSIIISQGEISRMSQEFDLNRALSCFQSVNLEKKFRGLQNKNNKKRIQYSIFGSTGEMFSNLLGISSNSKKLKLINNGGGSANSSPYYKLNNSNTSNSNNNNNYNSNNQIPSDYIPSDYYIASTELMDNGSSSSCKKNDKKGKSKKDRSPSQDNDNDTDNEEDVDVLEDAQIASIIIESFQHQLGGFGLVGDLLPRKVQESGMKSKSSLGNGGKSKNEDIITGILSKSMYFEQIFNLLNLEEQIIAEKAWDILSELPVNEKKCFKTIKNFRKCFKTTSVSYNPINNNNSLALSSERIPGTPNTLSSNGRDSNSNSNSAPSTNFS
ncbi:hypothetical protein ACTFIV_005189 [Dictyostelium citrinum]